MSVGAAVLRVERPWWSDVVPAPRRPPGAHRTDRRGACRRRTPLAPFAGRRNPPLEEGRRRLASHATRARRAERRQPAAARWLVVGGVATHPSEGSAEGRPAGLVPHAVTRTPRAGRLPAPHAGKRPRSWRPTRRSGRRALARSLSEQTLLRRGTLTFAAPFTRGGPACRPSRPVRPPPGPSASIRRSLERQHWSTARLQATSRADRPGRARPLVGAASTRLHDEPVWRAARCLTAGSTPAPSGPALPGAAECPRPPPPAPEPNAGQS